MCLMNCDLVETIFFSSDRKQHLARLDLHPTMQIFLWTLMFPMTRRDGLGTYGHVLPCTLCIYNYKTVYDQLTKKERKYPFTNRKLKQFTKCSTAAVPP